VFFGALFYARCCDSNTYLALTFWKVYDAARQQNLWVTYVALGVKLPGFESQFSLLQAV
jgi:hypothetical protein